MMIAPGQRHQRSEQTNAMCWAHLLMKKRTKHGHCGHGPLGCGGGDVAPASPLHERQQRLVVVNKDPMVSPMSAWTLTRSRAVRALSQVTVLCPFLHGRND